MTASNRRTRRKNFLIAALLATVTGLVAACGGGSGDGAATGDTGTAFITLTDAPGDFLTYAVDITSITLERADGTQVETLPNRARIDFTQYVDLTELFTAAQVPTGAYVGGAITLNYSTADVQVEVAGNAVPATVVDANGNLLGTYTLEVQLADQDRLIVAPGRPALLEIDFDLAASHDVDVSQVPPVATAAPFLVADVMPVDEKDMRIRGPVTAVDITAMSYDVRLRPWHRRDGDFGPVSVRVGELTEFEIDGVPYIGTEGLRALDALGAGAPSVARGILDVASRAFTATTILAGDSVPGHRHDTVMGNVVSRNANLLTVRGATIVPASGSVVFNDDVLVSIGPDTRVTRAGHPDIDIQDISVGQRVHVAGSVTSDPALPELTLDATQGRVRLQITRLTGTVNNATTGLLTMKLSGIDRREIDLFDFSGTGVTSKQDAEPNDYEVDTATLGLGFVEPALRVSVLGFANEFGAAPPDFVARSVIDVAAVRAKLAIGWLPDGTTAPFLSLGTAGLVPNLDNPDLGERHHLKIGDASIDLTALPATPTIVGADDRHTRFAIMQGKRIQVFRSFDRFVATLAELLDGSTTAHSMHASGRYLRDSNTLAAHMIGVRLSIASSPAAE